MSVGLSDYLGSTVEKQVRWCYQGFGRFWLCLERFLVQIAVNGCLELVFYGHSRWSLRFWLNFFGNMVICM